MKRPLLPKKIFCVLAALLIGCAPAASPSAPAEPEPAPTVYAKPTAVALTHPDFFGGEESNYKTKWLQSFSEETGVQLTVTVPNEEEYKNGYGAYLTQAAGQGTLSGLVYVQNQQQLLTLLNAGLLQPLDGLLEANESLSEIPADFIDAFRYGGSLWAVPAEARYTLPLVRSYDAALLQKAEAATPATTQELLTLATALGKDTPAVYAAGAADLADIFEAFGAPLGDGGQQYGYQTGCVNVVDSMLLPGAADALSYLRTLYAAGGLNADFLEITASDRDKAVVKSKGASVLAEAGTAKYLYSMQRLSKTPTDAEAWEEKIAVFTDGASLNASSTKAAVQAVSAEAGGYCLIKNSPQGGEAVNWLVDCITDKHLWRMMYLGLSDHYTVAQEGGYVLADTSKNSGKPVPTPSLAGPIEGLYGAKEHLVFHADTSELVRYTLRHKAAYLEQLLADGLAQGRLEYRLPQFYGIESATYAARSAEVQQAFQTLLRSAVTDENTTVEQALQTYRSTVALLGGDAILAEANAVYGLFPIQQYLPETAPATESVQ